MRKTTIEFATKKFLLLKFFFLALLAIGIRLFYLQIQQGDRFALQGKKNFTRYEAVLSPRGDILDTHGNIIATNRPVTSIYWKGTGNKHFSQEQEHTLSLFSSLFLLPLEEKRNEILKTERGSKKLLLFEDISFEQLSKIAELFGGQDNLITETTFKRHYPHKTLACHLLGYLGHLDNEEPTHAHVLGGKMGIEKLYENNLRGKTGSLMRIINSMGHHIAEFEIEKNYEGQSIVLTLDLELQKLAESVFPLEQSGILILLDPFTGSLRAVLSRPSFDPNMFLNEINKQEWNLLQEQKSFLNRICKASYPPGSIFKIVTFAAALDTGIVTPYSTWRCNGYSILNERRYHCARKYGHGELTLKQAFAHSCNIPLFDMAHHLDIDTIAKYAHIFGLGERTNLALQEDTGLIPTREWKRKTKGERWWLGETLSASIGQSFLLVTPIQMARMIASIETGFLTSIRITEDAPICSEPLKIKSSIRKFLQQAMYSVTSHGTARRLSYLHDFIIKAKTSTAQTSALSKRTLGQEHLEHGWLAANFTYKDTQPMTLIILTEKSGSARMAIDMAKTFLQGYRTIMQQRNPHCSEKQINSSYLHDARRELEDIHYDEHEE